MGNTKAFHILTAGVLSIATTLTAAAKNGAPNSIPTPSSPPAPPPAPVLPMPAAGTSLVQPITLGWNAVSDPDGPIGSYTWQVGTTSTFTTIIASGFKNMDSDPSVPTPTSAKLSGLP